MGGTPRDDCAQLTAHRTVPFHQGRAKGKTILVDTPLVKPELGMLLRAG